MDWLIASFLWYLVLCILGLGFLPITRRLFSPFVDKGYPFAKTIGILLTSYTLFVLGTLRMLPFTYPAVLGVTAALIIGNHLLFRKDKTERIPIRLLIFEELLFLGSFLFLTYIRGQEASIRGLEKFMDYGFMNSILRTTFFPPLDMWLSSTTTMPQGYAINYYYFGHLTGAYLIRLTQTAPAIGYNLILATIFAQGVTLAFSLCMNLVYLFEKYVAKVKKISLVTIVLFGLLGSYIVNLAGNLHTIYLFTKGYPNESPIPFWQIWSTYTPEKYWYPNATRFIPFTIHEFPSYSYVVADLHGHVFDIPFVLLTLGILFVFLTREFFPKKEKVKPAAGLRGILNRLQSSYRIGYAAILGFMVAIHYMTNAFDGPIYLLFCVALFLMILGFNLSFVTASLLIVLFFLLFALPFSINFVPFASGIGVNCSPSQLVALKKIGPFLFEKGNCQISPIWMLFVLWGFFVISFLLFLATAYFSRLKKGYKDNPISLFIVMMFAISFFLLLVPEFFYVKDIYPAHFRANTMFKLGYQAFMIMGALSSFVFYQIWKSEGAQRYILKVLFLVPFFLIFLYPFFSFPSFYGKLNKVPNLHGDTWLSADFSEDKDIIDYFNTHVSGQPVILEAQGDSYSDYERISAYTGLPTVGGWWVHEWLWRGSPEIIGVRIPDIVAIYESPDLEQTKALLRKYNVKYVVVSYFEKSKYRNIREDKFNQIGKKIFQSKNKNGAIYQVDGN